MSSGLLPDHIEPLVDRLRAGDHLPIALPDVAAVTEVLMRSLESYFKSIDLTLYKECQDLADYIEDARTEISSLSPDHDDSTGIPRAGQELDAIVEATESATDTIMQAAEDLMSFDSDDFDEYKNHINTEVMKIFEACSFQDITGQRISKVVKTLNHVEDRVGKLIAILGINSNTEAPVDAKPILDPTSEEIDESDLLRGPALAGEGIDQGEVDSLLNDQMMAKPEAQTIQDDPSGEVEIAQDEVAESNPDQISEALETTAEESDIKADETETVEVANEDVSDAVEDVSETTEGLSEEAAEVISETAENVPEAAKVISEDTPLNDSAPEKKQKNDKADAVNKAANEETSQDDIDSLFA